MIDLPGAWAFEGVYGWFVFLVFGFIGLVIYFLPTFIAKLLHHRNLPGVLLLNLLLGWMVIGWVGALIWAVYNERQKG